MATKLLRMFGALTMKERDCDQVGVKKMRAYCPCTPSGVMHMLDHHGIILEGQWIWWRLSANLIRHYSGSRRSRSDDKDDVSGKYRGSRHGEFFR